MFKIIEKIPDAKIALLKPNNPRTAWVDGKEVHLVLVEERGGNVHVQFFRTTTKRYSLTQSRLVLATTPLDSKPSLES